MKRFALFLPLLVFTTVSGVADTPPADPTSETLTDISYYEADKLTSATDYQKSQCKLDLYYPKDRPGFSTFLWLHGGGMTGGKRYLPDLKGQKIALVAVSYRLSPQGEFPSYIEDAAAATAWVFKHIVKYGGDPKHIFIGGHSAGGYLAALVGMDPRWLAAHGMSNMDLAGIIPVSGQMTTHFLVREMRGDTSSKYRPVVDEYAPIFYASKDLPPLCLITGDRRIEYKARVEENEFLYATLRAMGNERVEFYEMGGVDHAGIPKPSATVAKSFITRIDGSAARAAAAKAATAAKQSEP